MSDNPQVILSAFADEAANHKTAIEQFSALAAIGLKYYSPRFLDVNGSGEVKHVVELNKGELKTLNNKEFQIFLETLILDDFLYYAESTSFSVSSLWYKYFFYTLMFLTFFISTDWNLNKDRPHSDVVCVTLHK